MKGVVMTRIVVIDPQPAIRAGLAMMLRAEPGLVPVGSAVGAKDGLELAERQRPDVVLLDGDELGLCRRLRALPYPPRVVLYHAGENPSLAVSARVAGADGLVHKEAAPEQLFEALRLVARGESALPPLDREQLDLAAHRVEPEDLALLAMLMDRAAPEDVATTLRMDRRKVAKRIERLLGRLRGGGPGHPRVA
jgi:DNA-binding NarL/FixJ family response regulator